MKRLTARPSLELPTRDPVMDTGMHSMSMIFMLFPRLVAGLLGDVPGSKRKHLSSSHQLAN